MTSPVTIRHHRSLFIALALGLGLLPTLSGGAPEGATFRFAPPINIEQIRSVRTASTTRLADGTKHSEMDQYERSTAFRTNAGGYIGRWIFLSQTRTRDGKQVPLAQLGDLRETERLFQLSLDGKISSVAVSDAALSRALKGVPKEKLPEAAAQAKQIATGLVVATWQKEVGAFLGRSAEVGTGWYRAEYLDLPAGKTSLRAGYYGAFRVMGKVTVQGHACVRVQYRVSQNAASLAALLGPAMAPELAKLKPLTKNLVISGGGEMVIDPATGMGYGSHTELHAQIGDKHPVKLDSNSKVTVRYRPDR
jgi:hypothetical protein